MIKNYSKILEILPNNPGVYLFKDKNQTILYIGKATDLKSRVSSYFSGRDSRVGKNH